MKRTQKKITDFLSLSIFGIILSLSGVSTGQSGFREGRVMDRLISIRLTDQQIEAFTHQDLYFIFHIDIISQYSHLGLMVVFGLCQNGS